MKVAVSIRRAIVVDDDINTLDVDTATEDISGNKDTLLEIFESGISVDTGKE